MEVGGWEEAAEEVAEEKGVRGACDPNPFVSVHRSLFFTSRFHCSFESRGMGGGAGNNSGLLGADNFGAYGQEGDDEVPVFS